MPTSCDLANDLETELSWRNHSSVAWKNQMPKLYLIFEIGLLTMIVPMLSSTFL
jgi:hypothetical protein